MFHMKHVHFDNLAIKLWGHLYLYIYYCLLYMCYTGVFAWIISAQ